jgi:hypothetical protein
MAMVTGFVHRIDREWSRADEDPIVRATDYRCLFMAMDMCLAADAGAVGVS